MTKSVVEVVILTLNKASTTKELSSNKLHQSCLDTVRAAEGCRQVTWGVTQEDDRKLVWLVEWNKVEDHTQGFEKSSVYPQFKQDLLSMTQIDSLVHFNLNTYPSTLLSSSNPVLEILQASLKDGTSHEQNFANCQPIVDGWHREGRAYANGTAIDESAKSQFMFIVPWSSADEHWQSAKQEYFVKALDKAKPTWDIHLYSHVTPLQQ